MIPGKSVLFHRAHFWAITKATEISEHHLWKNHLTGMIPSSLGKCNSQGDKNQKKKKKKVHN